jgi:outer membrane protein OmpA-like peptidoglycan-associated protein
VLSPDRIETLDPVQFERNNPTKISKASFNLLGQVGSAMRAHPEIIRLRVTCHVNPGKDDDKDQELSNKRAQAVRDWLVQWGIAANRVEARGFGGTKPLAQPGAQGAASINDRIELIILERK